MMDQREHFFVTLPATASSTEFPNNRNDSFRVRLASKLRLDLNEWEVNLAEISVPNKFHNIDLGEFSVKVKIVDEIITRVIHIDKGWYKYPNLITRAINEALMKEKVGNGDTETSLSSHISISYNPISGYTGVDVGEAVAKLTFGKDIQECLGIKEWYETGIHLGTRPADSSRGFSLMYVYSDVVSPWHIGDVMVPLLRLVPVHGVYGYVLHQFLRDQFVPAAAFMQDTVEINIRKDNGERVTFVDGKVVLTLCFRRRS